MRPGRAKNSKAAREDHSEDYCWGRNPVISLLEDAPARCLKVAILKTTQRSVATKIVELCRVSNIPYSFVDSHVFDGIMMDGESHQGVVATVSQTELISMDEAVALIPPHPQDVLVVLMDHVQDPRNLGAMMRSAEAASAVFAALPLRRSSLPTGTVAKTSAGASLRLPIAAVGNVANAVRDLQDAGLWVVGLEAGVEASIYDSPLPARIALVVGAEGHGLTRTTMGACDEVLRIPISGKTGSLNASVALSVCMFEWSRQNGNHKMAGRPQAG
jgi:23S rRNA (guanosine2251-2'-O)-methyltransferase